MSENLKEKRASNGGGQESETQEGGLSMSPPAFQLMASPVPPPGNGGGGGVVQRQAAPEEQGAGLSGLPAAYLAHLRLREGFRDHVYLDSRGLPTAGTGHLLTASERRQYPLGTRIQRSILDRWLEQDARTAYDAAVSQARQLGVTSQAFINALGSVNFQLGTSWNEDFRQTWRYMMQHRWEQAAIEAADSAWASQTPVRLADFQAALRALATGGTSNPGGHTGGNTSGNTSGNTGSINRPPVGAQPANPGAGATQTPRTGTITGDNVNVRSGPGTNHPRVGAQLDRGAAVTVFEQRDGWMRIGNGRWVIDDYIRLNPSLGTPIGTGTVTGENVNVRKGPGTNHDTIGNQMDRGDTVTVYEQRDGWLRIGLGRWIKGQYVRMNGAPTTGGHTNTPTTGGHTNTPTTGGHTNTPTTGGHTNTPTTGGNSGRRPTVIDASVGQSGRNVRADVTKIQQLLGAIGLRNNNNGTCDKNTIGAIAAFQEAMGIPSDGRVDPGGRTLELMNNTPTGAFTNTRQHLREDRDAPRLTHTRWTNKEHLTVDTAGEVLPRQFYSNMNELIRNMNTIGDNLRGTLHVNCGYRSPFYNGQLRESANQSNHQFGRAVDISSPNYTPSQLRAELRRLIREGKIHNGGIGLYSWGCHYDIDNAREWGG